MQSVANNLLRLESSIPDNVRIVAVSKTRTPEEIMELYKVGHRLFGENRVQELLIKKDHLPADISWHLIGHLQTNKVKFVVPFVSMIQSVDSYKLLKAINKEAVRFGREIDCLLQVHIASEETKYGFSMAELREMLNDHGFKQMRNVVIRGLMGMATFTDDHTKVRSEFSQLSSIFNDVSKEFFNGDANFNEISMGMSGDYQIAIQEGSTIIRVGTLLFGER